MSIIDRYLIREVLKFFGIILIAVIGIFLAVDFFEKIDDFIESGLPLTKALVFFWFRIPFVISLIGAVAILLSFLIVFGLMNKNNELIALRCGGVSAFYLLRTIFAISILGSLILFYLNDQIVPETNRMANYIWEVEVNKRQAMVSREKNIWVRGNQSIAHIRMYDNRDRTISGVTLYYFDDDFRLKRRLDAASGQFTSGIWTFRNVIEQVRAAGEGEGQFTMTLYKEKVSPFEFAPEDLRRVVKRSDEMNYAELLRYIRAVQAEGYDATSYRVDLHAKLAAPVGCFILSLPVAGFAVKRRKKEGLSKSIAYGLGLTFIYFVFMNFSLSLGHGGMLPPFVAAWTANAVFLGLGLLVLLYADY